MKKAVLAVLCFFFTASLYGQSLAELAKKEKERRESLKAAQAKVVTNEDLQNIRKKPAVTVGAAESEEAVGEGAVDQGQAGATAGSNVDRALPPAQPSRSMPVTVAPSGPALMKEGSSVDQTSDKSTEDLQAKLKEIRERIDLLTTKLNSLWHDFYNNTDMTFQNMTQQQISETYEKLTKAQEEEAKLKDLIGPEAPVVKK